MKNEINTTPSYKLFNAFGDIKDEYIESAITEKSVRMYGISATHFSAFPPPASVLLP